MGVFKNKVTRRVALGSIAGGLATATAVLYRVRSKYRVELPEGNANPNRLSEAFKQFYKNVKPAEIGKKNVESYVADWHHRINATDVSIKTVSGPTSFTLQYKIPSKLDLRVLHVETMYDVQSSTDKLPTMPSWYTVASGRIHSIAPIANSTAVLVAADKAITESLHHHEEMLAGQCAVTLAARRIQHYYEIVDHSFAQRGIYQLPLSAVLLAQRLFFPLPMTPTLTQSAKWVVPKGIDHGAGLSCEVIGFADVGGEKTVKVEGRKEVSYKPGFPVVAGGTKKSHTQLAADVKEKSKSLQKANPGPWVEKVHVVAYLDLETGIAIREQTTTQGHDTTCVSVMQVA